MARPGDVLEDRTPGQRIYPTAGQRIVFRKTAQETNGESLQFDLFMKPYSSMPKHTHPHQEERLEVVSGSVRFRIGGREQSGSAEQVLVIPPGTSHDFWPFGGNEAHLLIEFRPALRSETFFETLFRLAQNRKTWFPELLQTAVLLREYKNEVRPPFVKRVFVGLLAPIGRILGYKAQYPQSGGSG